MSVEDAPEIPDLEDPRLASASDELTFWSSRFGALLFDHLDLLRQGEVLDLGCGTGFPLFELANVHGDTVRCTGVDLWLGALARARFKRALYRLHRVRLVRADAAALPFRDRCFDLIVSNLGVNNFRQPSRVLSECFRVARPGGRLVLTTNPRGHLRELYAVYRQVLVRLGKEALLPKLARHEGHRLDRDALSELLEGTGLRTERVLEEPFVLRCCDGRALLRHTLVRYSFLEDWRRVVAGEDEAAIFRSLEAALDELARSSGELRVTVPMLYLEARRP